MFSGRRDKTFVLRASQSDETPRVLRALQSDEACSQGVAKRRDDGDETTAMRRQRWQDDGSKAATAMKKKKPAADIAISILFIYICVRFLVICAVSSSYLFPAVVVSFILMFGAKFLFLTLIRGRVIFDARSRQRQKLRRKFENLIFSLSAKFKG